MFAMKNNFETALTHSKVPSTEVNLLLNDKLRIVPWFYDIPNHNLRQIGHANKQTDKHIQLFTVPNQYTRLKVLILDTRNRKPTRLGLFRGKIKLN